MMRGLSADTVEHVLLWLDLASHLRLREASRHDRDETPRRTRSLAARDWEQARRCQEKFFTPDKNTRLHSITLDIAAPNTSRSSSSGSAYLAGAGVRVYPQTHHLSSYNSSLSKFLEEASCASRRAALSFLVREHRPAELRFKNMIRGGEFSEALLSLEKNLDQVRKDLRVLHLGLATGGPRPYQDPRSHYWCMLRLTRLLGRAHPPNGGGSSAQRDNDALARELTDLTKGLLGDATAAATMPHLMERDRLKEEGNAATSPQGFSAGGLTAYWPRLSELRLACGIMGGDLERLSTCLGSFPNLRVLDLRGHAFRPPTTDLIEFSRGLRTVASFASPKSGSLGTGKLTTLLLINFKMEGVDGVTALGQALSEQRFPHLAALSIDSCRLADQQLCALAETLPGMSRTLTSLSFRSNYALSAEGIKALAKALRTGSGSRPSRAAESLPSDPWSLSGSLCRGCNPVVGVAGSNEARVPTAIKAPPSIGDPEEGLNWPMASTASSCTGVSAESPAAFVAETAAKTLVPERAPAWSVPSPLLSQRSKPVQPHPEFQDAPIPSLGCRCLHRHCRPAPSFSGDDVDDGGDGVMFANASPLRLDSLDLSYCCWWSRPQRTTRLGRETSGGPFTSLLEVLRDGGPLLSLKSLRLEGCYLGDAAAVQLVAALESESGSCRALRVLNVNGNLFGEVGVRRFAEGFLSGRMPPKLRMVVFCTKMEPSYRKLQSGMSHEDMNQTIGLWLEHQRGVHASVS